MKPLNIKRIEMVIISLLVSFAVLLSVVPCSVLAEDTSTNEETLNNKTSSGQSEAEENYDIDVTVGMPSYANVYKDIYVDLTYNDDFFELPSSVYNNDLAYASACLAATSISHTHLCRKGSVPKVSMSFITETMRISSTVKV